MDRGKALYAFIEPRRVGPHVTKSYTLSVDAEPNVSGPFFRMSDLPEDPFERDRILLLAVGLPDPLQIDGFGAFEQSVQVFGQKRHSAMVESKATPAPGPSSQTTAPGRGGSVCRPGRLSTSCSRAVLRCRLLSGIIQREASSKKGMFQAIMPTALTWWSACSPIIGNGAEGRRTPFRCH